MVAEMAIFGVFVSELLMPINKKNAFAFASLLAQRRIGLEWKSSEPPVVPVK